MPAVSVFSHPTVIKTGKAAPLAVSAVITRSAHWREVNLNRRTTHADTKLLMILQGIIAPPK